MMIDKLSPTEAIILGAELLRRFNMKPGFEIQYFPKSSGSIVRAHGELKEPTIEPIDQAPPPWAPLLLDPVTLFSFAGFEPKSTQSIRAGYSEKLNILCLAP